MIFFFCVIGSYRTNHAMMTRTVREALKKLEWEFNSKIVRLEQEVKMFKELQEKKEYWKEWRIHVAVESQKAESNVYALWRRLAQNSK